MISSGKVDACTDFVVSQVKYIIETFGPRAPGSPEERAAQEYLHNMLKELVDPEAELEEFRLAPKAFAYFQRVAGILAIISVPLCWISPWLALCLSLLAGSTVLFEFVLYWQFLDVIFPKGTSCNVMAAVRPAGEVKRRIIINGHPDSSYEFRYNQHCPKLLMPFGIGSIIGLILVIICQLAMACCGWSAAYGWGWYLFLAQILLMPVALLAVFFNNLSVVVPGANDNLTGALMAAGVARFLHESGVKLENTELVALITGSEEAGLRGAKAFVKQHDAWLREKETVVLTIDTIRDLEHMHVYTRDLNATLKHHPGACSLLHSAGEACGMQLGEGAVYVGSSDATAFTQAGIPATAICAMDPAPADWYHTRRDDCDLLNPECIHRGLEVVFEFIRLFDERGLPG